MNIKSSAVELLDVMLERTDEKSDDLIQYIANSVDVHRLHDTLSEFYELMTDQRVKEKGYNDEAETGLFRTYHALVQLKNYRVLSNKIGKISIYLDINR